MHKLTKAHRERYSRQIAANGIGEAGQIKIMKSKILLIGLGGLGSPSAYYLTGAGVGTIGIIDNDTVDISNLHRQIIHFSNDRNIPKVESAAQKMKALNPEVKINSYHQNIEPDNIIDIISEYDFVISATDTFRSKFLINDACFFAKKPLSHAGITQWHGQAMTIIPGETACFRCLFNEAPVEDEHADKKDIGVFGPAAGILGLIQSTEAIKYITGNTKDLLTDQILSLNIKTMENQKIKMKPQKNCPLCGETPSITQLV